jgi:hypothetical protein
MQRVLLRGRVEGVPQHAAAGARDPRIRVDFDRPQAAEVDRQAVVTDAEPGDAVPTAAYGHRQAVRARHVHRAGGVGRARAARDRRRAAVDHAVEDRRAWS